MTDPRYPIGKWDRRDTLTPGERAAMIAQIGEVPARMRTAIAGLDEAQLDTPYREGGWTVRQVVHHVPDSHLNAYIRMKLAVTEDTPAIKTYEEALWAELPEAKSGPVDMSLGLLQALHGRWVAFLRALPESHFTKAFVHPQVGTGHDR